jgi:hypothetical protein
MMDDNVEEIVLLNVSVTCTNAACKNFDRLIEVVTFEHAQVICGPCGTVLDSDVAAETDEQDEE